MISVAFSSEPKKRSAPGEILAILLSDVMGHKVATRRAGPEMWRNGYCGGGRLLAVKVF